MEDTDETIKDDAAAQQAPRKMTDAEATKLDWWLLDYLREQLFNPPAPVKPEPDAHE